MSDMSSAAAQSNQAETPSQSREMNLARDVTAIVLVAITLMMVVSIVTRSSADPIETPVWPISEIYSPASNVYPTHTTVTNACGYWGALLSSAMFDALGLASAFVIAAFGGVAAALLGRGRMNAPVLRSLGGTIIIIGAASAAALIPAQIEGMPVVGNGGYLGAMLSTLLLEHFAPTGAWILSLTVFAVGLLLTTDYTLVYAGKRILAGGAMVSRSGMQRAARAIPVTVRRRRQPFTDLEEPITIDGDTPQQVESVQDGTSNPEGESESDSEERLEPKIKFNRPSKKAALGAAAAAAAAGLAAGVGVTKRTEDEAHAEDTEDECQDEEEFEEEEEVESVHRELEVDEAQLELRDDQAHATPEPKIKLPNRKKPADAKQELYQNMREAAPSGSEDYVLPSNELLEAGDDFSFDDQWDEVRRKAEILEATFKDFGFNIQVKEIEVGPVISQYEIALEAGLRLSKITGLADDLAIALRAPSVRIVAPIPGKNTVGIEVPNETRQMVRIRDVIEEGGNQMSKMNIPVFLGKDVSGNPMVVGLEKMPHLLIAGRTGTGKSVCLNSIICSILMMCRPDEVRMLMIDPKMVELSGYGRLPHLMHPVITDMKKAEAILSWAVDKMEERYSLLAKAGVRHINSYNDLGRDEVLRRLDIEEGDEAKDVPDKLPFIVIIADEMADLMMTAGKDVETHIIRLAQKSRAVGIHLILATQKPTVDVITGLIKSNLPARLSFQVASKTDSRVVLDENGADKLLGNGDMLFLWPGTSTLIRGQGTYLSDEEIDRVCDHCSMGEQNFVHELVNLKVDDDGDKDAGAVGDLKSRDELYESAIEVVIREGRGSLSLLQRSLGIGYGRAARLIDFMAEDKIVGDYNGAKSRDVLMTMAQWQQLQGLEPEEENVQQTDVPEGSVADNVTEAKEEYEEEYEEYEEYEEAEE